MTSGAALALVWLLVFSLVAAALHVCAWLWRMTVENTRWLQEHGDRSRLVRACLWIDETLRRDP